MVMTFYHGTSIGQHGSIMVQYFLQSRYQCRDNDKQPLGTATYSDPLNHQSRNSFCKIDVKITWRFQSKSLIK